jgi:hypothetical protein
MSRTARLPTAIPSLKQFMLRHEVLSLYRSVIRATSGLDTERRREVREHAKWEILVVKSVADVVQQC